MFSEFGFGSRRLSNTDLIRIQNIEYIGTGIEYFDFSYATTKLTKVCRSFALLRILLVSSGAGKKNPGAELGSRF